MDGQLAGIVSLVRGAPKQWAGELPEPQIMWLSTLTTANAFRGQGWGRLTVEQALAFLTQRGEPAVYLDCKPGFNPHRPRPGGSTGARWRKSNLLAVEQQAREVLRRVGWKGEA